MAETVGALRGAPFSLVGRPNPALIRDAVVPLIMVVLFLVALSASLGRAGVLRSWSADFSGRGEFLVESCDEILNRGADQWGCRGWFTPDGQATVDRAQLVTSHGARVSERPYVGQRQAVFFEVDRFEQVYPVEYRFNELTRLYLSLLPRLMVMIGAMLWLVGWFATRNLDPNDLVTKDSVRFPQRFNWRGRGITWIVAAAGVAVLNYVVTIRLIGSLDVI